MMVEDVEEKPKEENSINDDQNQGLVISVTKSTNESDENNDQYTVYEVELLSSFIQNRIVLKKRFSQFYSLHHLLNRHFYFEKLPVFPAPKVFNKMDPELIFQRRLQLENYLKDIQSKPELFNSFPVRLFLDRINMSGQVCIITGSTSGIGKEVALALAAMDMQVIIGCRSESKGKKVVHEIKSRTGNSNVTSLHLDLSSLHSVRDFVEQFKLLGLPLHLLICNAGSFGEREKLTSDGFEMCFGVNYLGHFLLTKLLLDKLEDSQPSRVVVVTDNEHLSIDNLDLTKIHHLPGIPNLINAYGLSKLALVIWAYELSRKLKGGFHDQKKDKRQHNYEEEEDHHNQRTSVICVNPGPSSTNLFRNMPGILDWLYQKVTDSAEEGAKPILYASLAEELDGLSGIYIDSNLRERSPHPLAYDTTIGEKLWDLSELWISSSFQESTYRPSTSTQTTTTDGQYQTLATFQPNSEYNKKSGNEPVTSTISASDSVKFEVKLDAETEEEHNF
eukprot:TRINITY_DN2518_c0_g1_i3.p1 TRINITY_DN2518_c0_g1~~TRINITY_DN2518_c0_g1_i3.p1  ORF type:complete len:504 (+),score=82.71 TRINITY_DN2518_c0_g1_i3:1-1512(+)